MEQLSKFFRIIFNKLIHSIGFVPAIMGFGFLILAFITLELDGMGGGKYINENFKWLALEDPQIASTIISTITNSLISLTVFTFSMVMIVMSQSASQMSNRVVDSLIGESIQKVVLGFYVGTIVFSLFISPTLIILMVM